MTVGLGEERRGTAGRKRVLSGMRPTAGRLHLGNYHGALENWVRLQDKYECFFMIADWHALSTMYLDTRELAANVRELALDYLSAGLDPERCVIFVQSDVKEHAELHLLYSMLTPLGWLFRVPTYKEQMRELAGREVATYGFLGYPVLQAADITIYRADLVPVGKDQESHIELTREIVRRFNALYGADLPEPQALFTEVKVLPGLDGRKMSKSYDNYITMAEEPAEIRRKVRTMVTDPARVRRHDPGHPEVCTVFAFHRVYSPDALAEVEADCRAGRIGCVECKERLAARLIEALAPIRERRRELAERPGLVDEILADGAARARREAAATMERVRAAVGLGR